MKTEYFKEAARDLIALGSPIFFIVVLARVATLSNLEYLSQFIIAGILFYTFTILLKTDKRAGLGVVLLIFITIYYDSPGFTWFARIVFILFIGALYYLKIEKLEIAKSIALGVIATGISYYSVRFLF